MAENTAVVVNEPSQGITYYDLNKIKEMTVAQYLSKEGRILNVRKQIFYDRAVLVAGTALTNAMKRRVFTKGRGQADTTWNTGAAIDSKSDLHTNMFKGGSFEGGTTFICTSFEVEIFIPSVLSTASSLGFVTNPAPATETATQFSATELYYALTRTIKMTFMRGEQPMHNGFLYQFPSRFAPVASFGGDLNEGFISNGALNVGVLNGGWNQVHKPVVLDDENDFEFTLEPLVSSLAIPTDVIVTVQMVGHRIATLWA